jgi:hypothetical protein
MGISVADVEIVTLVRDLLISHAGIGWVSLQALRLSRDACDPL